MLYFTIKDIENLTGIKAHTLRIWEQRYALLEPKRKESLHRIYSNEDLKHILRIAFLYHNGWKISRIAGLSAEEIRETVDRTVLENTKHQTYVNRMIEAAVDFNEHLFSKLLEEMIEKVGLEKTILEVCYPFLQKVGMLWVTNRVIPAQEHFSSNLIQNKLIAEIDKLPSSKEKPDTLLFTPQGEFHELPLLFLHYLMKKRGWNVVYLGCNVTLNVLQPFADDQHLRYLFLHLITNFTGMDADDYFEMLCRAFPKKAVIATGEAALTAQRNFVNLKILRSDVEILSFINERKVI